MSEIVKERVKKSISKDVKVFLLNGFRYAGKLTNYDDVYIEIFDYVSRSYKLIRFYEIKDLEIKK